ncbi:MAG: type II toxin-antitoxin system RelE/ParE family toxin [Spirochaetaceae bacterium]|nr:type II toxin-antitoxin system RelE/ParE family toxin [Spirochaetaceae bacterium]
MAWTIKFAKKAEKILDQLDKPIIRRILEFLKTRVENDPRAIGEPLKGQLSKLWKYRVGDYRLICSLEDDQLMVLVVHIGHRREVYNKK